MPNYCCVYGCNSSSDKTKGISFHSFPNSEKKETKAIFKAWVNRLNRKNFKPTKNSKVCSRHFKDEDYELSSILKNKLMPECKSIPILKSDAVPSLFLKGEYQGLESNRSGTYKRKKLVEEAIESGIASENETEVLQIEADVDIIEPEPELLNQNAEIQCELGEEIYRNINCSFGEEEPWDNKDELYAPEDNAAEDDESEVNIDLIGNNKKSVFFVFWECLALLFRLCMECHQPVTKVEKKVFGGNLKIITECQNNHICTWESQPTFKKRILGSIAVSSALFLTGIGYDLFHSFAKTLNLAFITRSTFFKYVKTYVDPVVRCNYWWQKEAIMEDLKKSPEVRISGDGQYDSPGYSAKFCTYSIMDLNTDKIVQFAVVQRKMADGDLEKAGCEHLLWLLSKSINIKLFLSDRHKGIRKIVREKYKNIDHEFDVWHLAKSFAKKMKKAFKKSETLQGWKNSLINHLWWSSSSCGGDKDLLIEKFLSALNHICDIHEWKDKKKIKKCEHGEITEEKDWIKQDSQDFIKLKSVMTNKQFLSDLKHTNNFCHTSALESYHNKRLKYMPKRIHFPYDGMVTRSMLAIIDHNNNAKREATGYRLQYSKATKQWIRKKIYKPSSNSWRENLQENVMQLAEGTELPDYKDDHIAINIPKNIAPVARPNEEEEAEMHFSRVA